MKSVNIRIISGTFPILKEIFKVGTYLFKFAATNKENCKCLGFLPKQKKAFQAQRS